MAKVGNEARLILRLAAKEVDQVVEAVLNDSSNGQGFKNGYVKAVYAYQDILAEIVRSLEK